MWGNCDLAFRLFCLLLYGLPGGLVVGVVAHDPPGGGHGGRRRRRERRQRLLLVSRPSPRAEDGEPPWLRDNLTVDKLLLLLPLPSASAIVVAADNASDDLLGVPEAVCVHLGEGRALPLRAEGGLLRHRLA